MKYVSIFSGIEAASLAWEPLGLEPMAFAEIDEFPSAVLAARWPDVPNLGDVTKIDWERFVSKNGRPDILVAGPPCQAFSIAGLREGLRDPRGNMTLEFLRAVDEMKPTWVVFENVPGIMSDRTKAFEIFLEGLQEIGYIIDMDVLDAQHFGVAQRRRRVFVVGWRVEDILRTKTSTSRFIMGQILAKTLQDTLDELLRRSDTGQESSASASTSSDGLPKRMTSFGLREAEDLKTWLVSLAGGRQRFLRELATLGSDLGAKTCVAMQDMAGIRLLGVESAESQFIGPLWRTISGESSPLERSCTTSTSTGTTTNCRIYICATALLVIARCMCRLKDFLPLCENEGIIASTALKEFTRYAIRKNEQPSIFDGFDDVLDNLRREAEAATDALGDLGREYPPQIRPVCEGVPRHTQEGGQQGQADSGGAQERPRGTGGEGLEPTESSMGRTLLCMASGQANAEITEGGPMIAYRATDGT